MRINVFKGLFIVSMGAFLMAGCSENPNNPTNGSVPTIQAVATNTPTPTVTPLPTNTPTPTVHIHDFVLINDTLPTCGHPMGLKLLGCECGAKKTEEYTEDIAHTYGEANVVVPSTVKTVGSQISVCTVCGYEFQEEIPMLTPTPTPTAKPTPTPMATLGPDATKSDILLYNLKNGAYDKYSTQRVSWWFYREAGNKRTRIPVSYKMSDYNAVFRSELVDDNSEDKVIYLTMDCGYYSTNCNPNLDVFKKYNIPVTFFLTSMFINDDRSKDVILRMREEGHNLGNHTMTHPDMSTVNDERLVQEICGLEDLLYKKTGVTMDPFFRFPYGAYSMKSLKAVSDLGYTSCMWSIAYVDYDAKNQPSVEAILAHIKTYSHNGAMMLMHMDSSANCAAMEQVITMLLDMGYRFGNLYELRADAEEGLH